MKINIDKELELAHKQYIEDKKGIVLDLSTLSDAILTLQLDGTLNKETSAEFRKVISRTCEFIVKGEI